VSTKPRHFLDIADLSAASLRAIIEDAKKLKNARGKAPKGQKDKNHCLDGEMIGLIFEKPSTRTRISFDVGIRQMGGKSMVLTGAEMQLGRGETVADTARVLSRYLDMIMIRTFSADILHELADNATIPVINGLTDKTHPCQIMADVMTFEEHKGSIHNKKVVWSGDGNNVCASFIQASAAFNFELVIATPQMYAPDADILKAARARGGKIEHTTNIEDAVKNADAIVTDTWLSMHDDEETLTNRMQHLSPFRIDKRVITMAKPDAIFLHCLPAHREDEVTSEVFDSDQSVVFDEAENRLHVQKSIIRWCFGLIDD
jgi:ornithine carbamoyltransferase